MTSPASLNGTRTMFSIATLSRGRAPLAVSLAVFLLGFAAPEIRAQEEPTRLDELVVSDGRVQFFFFSAGQCIRISDTSINGVTYTIHSSYWQRRSGAGAPWEEIPGTQETGQVCSLSPDSAGEYRLVADISIGGERGLYSSNILTKAGTDPDPPAGLAPPVVTGAIVLEGDNDNPAILGSVLLVVVEFNEGVRVTAAPRVALTIGATTRHALYRDSFPFRIDETPCASGTCSLVFRYFIQASDSDMDGVSIPPDALDLNGGAIRDADNNPANLDLGSHAITNNPDVRVDGSRSHDPGRVVTVDIASIPENGDTYGVGEIIRVVFHFDRELIVTGMPQAELTIGDATRYASYDGPVGEPTEGVGPASLDFVYTVQAGDHDTDGISIPADAIDVNGGAVVNGTAGNATPITADLSHAAVSAQADHKVDAKAMTGTDPDPEAGLAPADQAAFDSLAVGKQIVDPVSDDRLVFLSPGRIREFDQGESYDGDYQYVNTGENMGTLTYTYDVTGNNPNVEKSVVELTFTSMTAGTFVHTYTETGSPPETLRGSFEFVDAPAEPVIEGDRAVLEEFYDATNGANWSSSTNWKTEAPLGDWVGVSTDASGRVAALELNDNQLSGSIPSSLGNLSNLELLSLEDNQLSGSITSSLGNLSNLEYLSLAVNQLSGSIPSSLGNLSNLEYLALAVNPLSGSIPSSLGNLSNLVNLHLTFNQLSGSIPSNLGNLSNLEYLDLWENQLSGSIPSSLGNLSNLEALDLSFNQLTGSIPSSLGNLSNLEKLWLRENQLSGSIPISLGNLSNLQVLSLSAGNDELCAPNDEAFQAWLNSIGELRWTGPTCPADAVQPKPADEVQATVEAAVEAGGGLRAGGPPVTIDMSTLFSFGAGVTADTDYTAQSSDPALVAAETTDERLVLTPGNSLPAEASSSLVVGAADGDPARATITVTAVRAGEMAEVEFTVEVEAAPSPAPAVPPLVLMLLAFMLLASGAWLQRRRRAVASF